MKIMYFTIARNSVTSILSRYVDAWEDVLAEFPDAKKLTAL